MVMVGNKIDVKERAVKPRMISFHRRKSLQYYDMSAKSNYNIEKPFLYLCRRLLGDSDVRFTEEPGWQPVSTVVDPKILEESIQNNTCNAYIIDAIAWSEAPMIPLPDEDDDL